MENFSFLFPLGKLCGCGTNEHISEKKCSLNLRLKIESRNSKSTLDYFTIYRRHFRLISVKIREKHNFKNYFTLLVFWPWFAVTLIRSRGVGVLGCWYPGIIPSPASIRRSRSRSDASVAADTFVVLRARPQKAPRVKQSTG